METNEFKENVRKASEYLARSGITVPHTQMLEAISRSFGERNWSTMRALLEHQAKLPAQEPLSQEKPWPDTWDYSKGPLPAALYVDGGGSYCPACGSNEVDPDAADRCSCRACGATWHDTYGLNGYRGLETAGSLPAVAVNDGWFDVDAYSTKERYDGPDYADEGLDGFMTLAAALEYANGTHFDGFYQVEVKAYGEHKDHEPGEVVFSRFKLG